jgi:hypothetical protein
MTTGGFREGIIASMRRICRASDEMKLLGDGLENPDNKSRKEE